jgi:hypothetical protein
MFLALLKKPHKAEVTFDKSAGIEMKENCRLSSAKSGLMSA